jgi:hypothetical protein
MPACCGRVAPTQKIRRVTAGRELRASEPSKVLEVRPFSFSCYTRDIPQS